MIEIYTSRFCPYCRSAKDLLAHRKIAFSEIDIAANGERLEEMVSRSGGESTVPQIFVKGRHIGGIRSLRELANNGGLERMLA